jgi:hypothetical protein
MLRRSSQLAGRIAEIYPFGGYAKNPILGDLSRLEGTDSRPHRARAHGECMPGGLRVVALALVGFQGRGCADGVQPELCHSLFLEALIFQ